MTPEEVYREIGKDVEEVSDWWSRKRKTLFSIAKWTIKLPRTTWFEYESSRKNRYLVLSIIMGRKYNDESMTGLMALQYKSCDLQKWLDNYCREMGWDEYINEE